MDSNTPTSSGRSTPLTGSRPASATGYGRPGSASVSPTGSGLNRISGKPLGAQKLMELCETFYKTFNEDQVTLDTHADNSIISCAIHNTFDDTFLRQVLYGMVRYRALLGSLMDSFYHRNSGSALREDIVMYRTYAYLTIFRLEELTFPQYRRLVDANEPQKMLVFLKYLFAEANLKDAVRDDWLKIYDKEFVDATIARLLSWEPQSTELVDILTQRVYLTKKKDQETTTTLLGSQAVRRTTSPAPFRLTEAKPKPLPAEELPPLPVKARPAPIIKQGPTKEEVAVSAAREVHKKEVAARFDPKFHFRLKTTERPTNIDKIRSEVEAERAQDATFKAPKAQPMPSAPVAPVKLNTAAILREDAVYRRKQEEEATALKRYEAELRDASSFKAWQAGQLEADAAQRAASIERRRQEMGSSHEAAIRARQQQIEENQDVGRQLKAEAKLIEEALAREREEAVKLNQQRHDSVVDARSGIGLALEKNNMEKKQAAEEERKRQAENARVLAEITAKELLEAKDLIMQLRALEKVPRQRAAEFDPTSMPDHGLLDGMSLVELRERLVATQRRARDEEERQRAHILSARQEKEDMIMHKAANIGRVRTVAAAQAAARKASASATAASVAEQSRVRHEQDVLHLADKLEGKRSAAAAERARLAAEEKRIRFEQMQQAAGASAVEENKFRELRSGAQREIQDRQTSGLAAANTYEATKARAQAVRMRNVKTEAKDKGDFVKAYDEKIRQLTMARSAEQNADLSRKTQMATSQHTAEVGVSTARLAAGYQPFSGTQTATMARLTALGRGQMEGG